MTILIIILGAIAVLIIWGISIYNSLVTKKLGVEEAWSSIDVFLKKRNDLIPNLVQTVKGYATHEANVLEEVTRARSQSQNSTTAKEQGTAENMMQNAMMNLYAVAEKYPDLKANTNFLALQQELSSLEDEIEMARRYYNGNVKDFNVSIAVFPSNMVANQFGYQKAEFFEIENAAERESVAVNFNK